MKRLYLGLATVLFSVPMLASGDELVSVSACQFSKTYESDSEFTTYVDFTYTATYRYEKSDESYYLDENDKKQVVNPAGTSHGILRTFTSGRHHMRWGGGDPIGGAIGSGAYGSSNFDFGASYLTGVARGWATKTATKNALKACEASRSEALKVLAANRTKSKSVASQGTVAGATDRWTNRNMTKSLNDETAANRPHAGSSGFVIQSSNSI